MPMTVNLMLEIKIRLHVKEINLFDEEVAIFVSWTMKLITFHIGLRNPEKADSQTNLNNSFSKYKQSPLSNSMSSPKGKVPNLKLNDDSLEKQRSESIDGNSQGGGTPSN